MVQPELTESSKSAIQLKEIDLTDKTEFLPVDKINNGLSVDAVVNKLKRFDAVPSWIKEFKKDVQLFVIAMLSKLFDRSPLDSAVLRCASIFDHQECYYCQEKSYMRNSKFT